MKLFITGVSGLLGINAALMARERFEVFGYFHTNPVDAPGLHAQCLDLKDSAAFAAHVSNVRPDVLLHTAGLTNVDRCEGDPDLAHVLNVDVSATVARAAADVGARLIHISSDHLFAGDRSWRREDDPPAPLNVYATSKWEAERAVLAICPNALIIRTNFYGWGPPGRTSFSDWILRGLRSGGELQMFDDIHFTPILINDLVVVLWRLLEARTTGVYHVAGRDRLSKYEFGTRLAGIFGLPRERIRPISVDELHLRARRPRDMSLDTEKAAALGVPIPGVTEGLQRLRSLEGQGWPALVRDAFPAHMLGRKS